MRELNDAYPTGFNWKETCEAFKEKDELHLVTEAPDVFSDRLKEIQRQIVSMKDESIRQGLKSLGWISPEDAKEVLARQAEESFIAGCNSQSDNNWVASYQVDEEAKQHAKRIKDGDL